MNIDEEVVKDHSQGDVFKINGRNYKLLKKTTTAVSVRRWYWFDSLGEWLWRRLASRNESNYD